MKKRIEILLLCMALLLLLSSCGCEHQWTEASCVNPKTCTLCQETEGAPLGHSWAAATCDLPKTCENCGANEGEAKGHTWVEATCTVAKNCSLCHQIEGEPLEHDWEDATTETPKTCRNCQKTEGTKISTDPRFTTAASKHLFGKWHSEMVMPGEMMGTTGYLDELPCTVFVEFGNDGTMTMSMELHDQFAFVEAMKKYTKDMLYEILASDGISQSEADAVFSELYGMSIDEYVELELANIDISEYFGEMFVEQVYYVTDAGMYMAESWNDEFEFSEYTLENDVLIIDTATLEEGGDPVEWTRVEE